MIEEIVEEESQGMASDSCSNSLAEYSVTPPVEAGECSQNVGRSYPAPAEDDYLKSFRDHPKTMRLFQNYISNADLARNFT